MKRNGYSWTQPNSYSIFCRRIFQHLPAFNLLLILMVFAVFTESCKKTSGIGGPTQTMRQYFSRTTQYSLFNKALQRASLDTLVGGTIPYTVFAVGDSDMIKSGYTAASIDTMDVRQLRRTLSYQIVQGSITKDNQQLYQEIPLITADSNILAYLEDNAYGFFYNGIPVVGVDSGLVNGIIQRMQTMATPPIGDLITTIARIPALSDYNFYLHNISSGNTFLSNATPSAPVTAYLPNNAAYAAEGLDDFISIQAAGGGINNYYTSYGAYFTNDFLGGSRINGYFAGFLLIAIWFPKDGGGIYPPDFNTGVIGPSTGYKFTQTNIIATNGVIHLIQPYSY